MVPPDPPPPPRDAERAEFADLYRAIAPIVRHYVAWTVGDDLADDIVSETFTVVFRRWRQAPEAPGDRRAWVFGVARRSAWAVMRRERAAGRAVAGGVPVDAVVRDHADRVVGDDRVDRLLAALPPTQRDAVWLTIWQGLTPREAARLAGCTDAAMRQRLARAYARLQELLATERQDAQEVDGVR